MLSEAGLSLAGISVANSSSPYGTIISQSIDSGTSVPQGTGVSVTISGGTAEEQQAQVEEQQMNNDNTEPQESYDDGDDYTEPEYNDEPDYSESGSYESGGQTAVSNEGETSGGGSSGGGSSSGGSSGGVSSTTFYVSIPDGPSDESVYVEVYVNGSLASEGTYSKGIGTVPVGISGSGEVNVTAYVDGEEQSQTINLN